MKSAIHEPSVNKDAELKLRLDFILQLVQKYVDETIIYDKKVEFWNKENEALELYLNNAGTTDSIDNYLLSERAKSILLRAATPSVEISKISKIQCS